MLTTAQIGAAGELLVQYRLLNHGIDSAPMTTDAGIDLVAFCLKQERAVTIQVKTCLEPKPAGGKGHMALDWWLRSDSPAEVVALANLSTDQTWLFTHADFEKMAQQRSPQGQLHLYFYIEPDYQSRLGCHEKDFTDFLIDRQARRLFSATEISN